MYVRFQQFYNSMECDDDVMHTLNAQALLYAMCKMISEKLAKRIKGKNTLRKKKKLKTEISPVRPHWSAEFTQRDTCVSKQMEQS